MSGADAVHAFILLVLLPLWLLTGLTDWYCHRKAKIEDTAGPRESVLHLALSGCAAAAILPALLLDIDALVLAVMLAAFVVHELVTNMDVRLALPARAFTPLEQRVHDALTAIPFAALCLVLATHVDQALAMFGLGPGRADWSLRLKDPPLPLGYILGWNAAALALNVAPFTEELLRCLAARARRDIHIR